MTDQISPPQAGTTGWVTLGNGQRSELAGLGGRLLARCVDFGFLILVASVLTVLGLAGSDRATSLEGSFTVMLSMFLLAGIVALLYEVVLVALRGQTLGKMLMGIKVARADNGELPGWGRSVGRWVFLYVPGMIPFVGWILQLLVYLSPVFSDSRQGWHDRVPATVVVRSSS